MKLELIAPGASEKHLRCAVAAAELIFAARGLSPEAAAMALPEHLAPEFETPASVRAAAIWRHASRVAIKVCAEDTAASPLAVLLISS